MFPAACSEFPNDNPHLHSGAIFAVEEVCGPPLVRMVGVDLEAGWAALGDEARAEVEVEAKAEVEVEVEADVEVEAKADVEVEVEAGVEVDVEADVEVDVEVAVAADVEVAVAADVEFEGAASPVPVEAVADAEVEEPMADTRPSGIYLSSDTIEDDIVIAPLEPLAEADLLEGSALHAEPCAFTELVEIMACVAEREVTGAGARVRELVGEGSAPSLPPEIFTSLVAGGVLLPDGSVGPRFDGARRAWRAILRNESEDFGPCGPLSLDEWAADLVARALGSASRAAMLKRHLRDAGVAAFGLSIQAA